jgi:hypothetical protein
VALFIEKNKMQGQVSPQPKLPLPCFGNARIAAPKNCQLFILLSQIALLQNKNR